MTDDTYPRVQEILDRMLMDLHTAHMHLRKTHSQLRLLDELSTRSPLNDKQRHARIVTSKEARSASEGIQRGMVALLDAGAKGPSIKD